MIYVIHEKETNAPVITGSGERHYANGTPYRQSKRQPKSYTSERNARIAVANMHGKGVIVPYIPRIELVAMYDIVRQLWTGDVPDFSKVTAILSRNGLELDGDSCVIEPELANV